MLMRKQRRGSGWDYQIRHPEHLRGALGSQRRSPTGVLEYLALKVCCSRRCSSKSGIASFNNQIQCTECT